MPYSLRGCKLAADVTPCLTSNSNPKLESAPLMSDVDKLAIRSNAVGGKPIS
jgi:hypothetical protein